MRIISSVLAASALLIATEAQAQSAAPEPVEHEPRFALGIERVASLNAMFFSLDDEDFALRQKSVTAGGPIFNPLSAPRFTFDYLSKSGLTIGGGLAFGLNDLDSKEDGEVDDQGSLDLLMLNPRLGYRIPVGKVVDLTPRVGATLGWASLTDAAREECDFTFNDATGESSSDCETVEGDSINLFATVVNLELAATFRLTDSFNLLTGVSYDLLVAASAQEKDSDGSEGEKDSFKDGHLSSLQLWLGLGGYLP